MARRARNSKGRFTKKNKSPKRRRNGRRRNPGGSGSYGTGMNYAVKKAYDAKQKKASKKKATKKEKAARRRIRPTVMVSTSGRYYRPSRSKYFKRPRMVNPRKRRHTRRKNGNIMSAIKRTLTVSTLSGYLSIGGGIFAGAMLSKMLNTGLVPFTTTALPESVTSFTSQKYVRPFQGILHIVLGTVIASKVKNKYLKDAGMGLAAMGGYDLLSQALSFMGVANLPSLSGMNVDLLGRTSYSGMNVNMLGGGMNVDLMGDARASDAESGYLADNINDMLS